jgi:hypothetical protein
MLRAVLIGMLREGDRNALSVLIRDGRIAASTRKAAYGAGGLRLRDFVPRRSCRPRARAGRCVGRGLWGPSGRAESAHLGTRGWFRVPYSRLERYAGGCPKSSAERLIDCEEDRTLRAVLVGMLQEMERR